MLDGMSDSIQGSRIENLHSREVDRQSPTGLILILLLLQWHRTHWPGWFVRPPRSASATKLRQQLHWLPIRQRITYKISLITYKTRTTGTPTYLFNLIHDYIPTRTLRSSNKLLLTIPQMSLAMSAKSFSLSSPSVWNSLPYSCRSTKTVTTFKRALKTELFAIAYGSHQAQLPFSRASDSPATYGALQMFFD